MRCMVVSAPDFVPVLFFLVQPLGDPGGQGAALRRARTRQCPGRARRTPGRRIRASFFSVHPEASPRLRAGRDADALPPRDADRRGARRQGRMPRQRHRNAPQARRPVRRRTHEENHGEGEKEGNDTSGAGGESYLSVACVIGLTSSFCSVFFSSRHASPSSS